MGYESSIDMEKEIKHLKAHIAELKQKLGSVTPDMVEENRRRIEATSKYNSLRTALGEQLYKLAACPKAPVSDFILWRNLQQFIDEYDLGVMLPDNNTMAKKIDQESKNNAPRRNKWKRR